ncbi:MAG TPA: hypothetical protein DCZ94_08875 [Lentisphaeria bacterium]|nr:MAG: hypothetical protein A2X48_23525 [Lentisphaerae bacterium GWF2_49_21]HBC87053.1 hypothetical protein [Lentisphaeria bacterium]
MNIPRIMSRTATILAISLSLLILLFASTVHAEDSTTLCAQVQLTISQEASFERQGFEAHMKISNAVEGVPITDVGVTVLFEDEKHNPVVATMDPNASGSDIRFFYRLDTDKTNISGSLPDGTARVDGGKSSDIYWLIIPSHDPTNTSPKGKLYFVGAELRYKIGGEDNKTVVSPDFIYVKPTPMLSLDYFLPKVCVGDDPNTSIIEPSEPFALGVRVRNDGYGPANSFTIDSAQPKIVNNSLGLLIGFRINSSEVNGSAAEPTLKVSFGDVKPLSVSSAAWWMETTLAGTVQDFKADFSHADALGGKVTSLISQVNTHYLAHRVLSDAPGSDSIRDFLAVDGTTYSLYNSEILAPQEVTDQSSRATLTQKSVSGSVVSEGLDFPQTSGYVFVRVPDPFNGGKVISSVIRSDGKKLLVDNFWVSREPTVNGGWSYYLNLFDFNTPGSYVFSLNDAANTPKAPVLQYISDKTVAPGKQVSFIVEASDQNGDAITISSSTLPSGAKFNYLEKRGVLTIYAFDWTPTAAQIGEWPFTFTASDGALQSKRSMTITVGDGGYSLSVVNGTGSGSYAPNHSVSIAANPAERGKAFDRWTGDIAGIADINSSSTTLTMASSDIAVTATYKDLPQYNLAVVNGSGSGQYYAGDKVDIAAGQPGEGYVFGKWKSDTQGALANSMTSTTTVTMPSSNLKVEAVFARLGASFYTWNASGALFQQKARDSIVSLHPDFIFLTDAGSSEDLDILVADLSLESGFTYYLHKNDLDGAERMAFISRFPIANPDVIADPALAHQLMKADIAVGDKLFTVFGVKAREPSDAQVYSAEADQILSLIESATGNSDTVILGELNSRSVLDGASDFLQDTEANNDGRGYATPGYAYPNTYFTTALSAKGYVDTWRSAHPDIAVVPTRTIGADGTLTANSGERVHYCLVSGDLAPVLLDAGINSEFDNSISTSRPAWSLFAATDGTSSFGAVKAPETPTIQKSSLAPDDSYVDITFNQDVFADSAASQPLTADNFELTFNRHGTGRATAYSIVSVKAPDSTVEAEASQLAGGEKVVRLFIQPSGYPNGNETVMIHLAGGIATAQNKAPKHIYNSSGVSDLWTVLSGDIPYSSTIRTNYHRLNRVDPPIQAVADNYQVDEDNVLTVLAENSLTANDRAEGAVVVIDTAVPAEQGVLNLDQDGTFTFIPALNFNGNVTFSYHLAKDGANSESADVAIAVNAVDDAPAVSNAIADVAVDEDSAAQNIDLSNVFTDVDSDVAAITKTVAGNTNEAVAAVVITDNTLTLTPVANANGTSTITVRGTSNGKTVDTAFKITVNPVNDAPLAVADAAATDEDTPVAINVLANDTDIDVDTLSISAVTQGAHGAVAIVDGRAVYSPAANFNGTDVFTYTASDGNGGTAAAEVTVTISAVNDIPAANGQNIETDEDTAIAIVLAGGDVDGDAMTFAVATQPENGTLTGTAPNLAYTPNANFNGTDSFTFKANDGKADSAAATVSITVKPVDDPPYVANAIADLVVDEDAPAKTIDLSTVFGDIDSDAAQITKAVTGNTNGGLLAATITENTLTLTFAANANGTATITVRGTSNGKTADASFAVAVNAVNDAPVAVADTAAANEDTPVTIDVLANDTDVDGDALGIASVTQGAHGSVAVVDAKAVYTPAADFNGADSFSYTISDGKGGNATAVVTLTINAVNDAPVANDDIAVIEIKANPSSILIDELTGTLSINPSNSQNNIFSITTDEGELITLDTLTAQGHSYEYNSVIQRMNVKTKGQERTLHINGTALSIPTTTNFAFDGEMSVHIHWNNSGQGSWVVDFSGSMISISPVPPGASSLQRPSVVVDVLSNDTDIEDDTLAVTAVTNPQNGIAVINSDGTVTYKANIGFTGSDSFEYTVADGNGGTDTGAVKVGVISQNEDAAAAAFDSIEGDLNINPATASCESFYIKNSTGTVIGIEDIIAGGTDYTYTGFATEVRIKVKEQGKTVQINGIPFILKTDLTYVFTGDILSVIGNRNANDALNSWWISISGQDVSISLAPAQ